MRLLKRKANLMVPIEYYLVLSAILFGIGIWGVLRSRNAIVIFMSIELMLNAVNLSIITFSSNMKEIMVRFISSFPADKIPEIMKSSVASGQVIPLNLIPLYLPQLHSQSRTGPKIFSQKSPSFSGLSVR